MFINNRIKKTPFFFNSKKKKIRLTIYTYLIEEVEQISACGMASFIKSRVGGIDALIAV